MFCPKCGTKALDGATFCQKCGAKLITDSAAQQSATSMLVQQTPPSTHNVPSDTPKKKKSKKLPIILGAVALAVVVIIVIAMNWNGKIDYEATVRAHQPFVSQGTSLTYGEVLDKYISSPDWKVRKSGDVNYVDISGKAKGTDNELVVTIKVTEDPSDPDLASISPESVTINGKKSPTQNDAVEFLLAMFLMSEEGYDTISDLFSNTANPSETQSPNTVDVNYEGVSLSQLLYLPTDEVIALLGPPVIHDEYKLAYDTIEFDLDGGRITGAESFSPESFALGGTPLAQDRSLLLAILGEPTKEGEGGSGYETTFEQNGYVLTIATDGKDGAAWRISIFPNAERGTESATADELLYQGVPVDQLLGVSPDDFISIFGEPDTTNYGGEELIYGSVTINIDMWSAATPYLSGIHSSSLDDFTYNGLPLSDNYDELTQIMGKEPDEARVFGDAYSMSYQWEHMGSPAWLTIETPAAEGSTANTQVGVSWWVDTTEEYQEPSEAAVDPNATQNRGMVSYTDLLGTWQWQGKNAVDAALGVGGTKQLTLYSNGTCKGEIATSGNVNGEFILTFVPDAWSFLEYEQVLQASAMTTGWDWDSNGSPIEVPVYKTMNFKVTMSGNAMYLENVENPGSKYIEYIKVD